ncbi:MAG: acylphosphatase, partial [Methanomicrobiales archaeon]|nr:acylphosphatase [Methanomicrobiales archaeon]
MKTVEIHVSGRVQSVGFRACTRKIATHLGITGEVMNLPDG